MFGRRRKTDMVPQTEALPGRDLQMPVPPKHFVLGTAMVAPWPENMQVLIVGMGCFWGAERKFWQAEGVYSTQVGYAAGFTPNPSYEEVCSGQTGHNEVVQVVFDAEKFRSMRSCKSFGKTTTRHRACAKAMMSARNIARGFTVWTRHKRRPPRRAAMCIKKN